MNDVHIHIHTHTHTYTHTYTYIYTFKDRRNVRYEEKASYPLKRRIYRDDSFESSPISLFENVHGTEIFSWDEEGGRKAGVKRR